MKLFFYIDQFFVGGAGRVASILINELYKSGFDIKVETNTNYPFTYPISEKVDIIPSFLNKKRDSCLTRKFSFYNRVKKLRSDIKAFSPDAIIAFLPNQFLETLIACIGLNIPIIVSDHTSMGRDMGFRINFIRRRIYSLAAATTVLTQKDFNLLGSRNPGKIVVYNPLTFSVDSEIPSKNKTVLCVGRVDSWDVKGFDNILKIWKRISKELPDWNLKIAGPYSNHSMQALTDAVEDFSSIENVEFLGQVNNMEELYKRAAVFALPSRVEGFPMVLTEAMSKGCACISFGLQGAIKEIITDNYDGIIVEDQNIEAFEHQLRQLLTDQSKQLSLAENALASVNRFSIDRFKSNWINIISNTTKKHYR